MQLQLESALNNVEQINKSLSREEALQLCRELLQQIIMKQREIQHLELTLKLHLRHYGFILAEYSRSYVFEGEEFQK